MTRIAWAGREGRAVTRIAEVGRAAIAVALGAGVPAFVLPATAEAHGLGGRADLPIPEWLFGTAASVVLVVSFLALAALWTEPKLEEEAWRPLPGSVGRALASRPVEIAAGAVGVFLLGIVVWSGLFGVQVASATFAPTFVFVIFWVGLVPLSVVFGDVYRAFNPWRATGRAVASVAQRLSSGPLPSPLPYPERLGRWPAVAGILAFTWLELTSSGGGGTPLALAMATLLYSALTFVGMALYGVDAWIARAEAFSVYFNLFSRMAPFERRGDEVGLRRPLSGLPKLDAAVPGTVPLLAVMIGGVTFDGAAEGELWSTAAPALSSFFGSLGLSAAASTEVTFALGLVASVLLVYGFYRLGVAGARTVGGGVGAERLRSAFVHSLVPIALVYVGAHYLTLLLLEGQAIVFLASDPLGRGWDLLGTAGRSIDYTIIDATTTWYLQVALVVTGHVVALTLAHDRALVAYDDPRLAVRSQYWLLAVMVGFTSLALVLLAQANQ